MKKMMNWVMAAILICGAGVFTSCSSDDDENVSIDVNYNPSTETRSFNRVLDRVKSDMAEINFQDLDILNKSLREGTATISCTDHNDAGIKKAVVDLRVLLENFFAVDSERDIYRPGIIVQSKLINNGEKATFKEFLEALGGTFESLLKGLIE